MSIEAEASQAEDVIRQQEVEGADDATTGESARDSSTEHTSPTEASSLKRKQSASPEAEAEETRKKRRLSSETVTASAPQDQADGRSPSPAREPQAEPTTTDSPSPRRPSPSTRKPKPINERHRTQRLFGSILSSLSSNSSPELSKRREIERKQREKLRAQAEEDDAAREERLGRLREVRMKEQRRWDREGARIDQENRRAMANFLCTKAEPRLYWRPWELTETQEDRVRGQKEEVEEQIERENERAREDEEEDEDVEHGARSEKRDNEAEEVNERDERPDVAMSNGHEDAEETSKAQAAPLSSEEPGNGVAAAGKTSPDADDSQDKKDDLDEGAEDIHGEDAVIY